MAQMRLGPLLEQVYRSASPAQNDAELLRRYIVHGDESVFASVVRRHGPLVLGVCRRVLRDAAEAEDAFQAVFFVLARRAAAIRNPAALAGWLYEVALRVSLRARAKAQRRRREELRAGTMKHAKRPSVA